MRVDRASSRFDLLFSGQYSLHQLLDDDHPNNNSNSSNLTSIIASDAMTSAVGSSRRAAIVAAASPQATQFASGEASDAARWRALEQVALTSLVPRSIGGNNLLAILLAARVARAPSSLRRRLHRYIEPGNVIVDRLLRSVFVVNRKHATRAVYQHFVDACLSLSLDVRTCA
jgi:hypothetical protein